MDIEKKYELIPSDKEGLYRIKALKDFNDVKKGDIGGYVESECNLSQYDNCWIYDNAVVRDKAVIRHNAKVYDKAEVWFYAVIQDNARVFDNTQVYGSAFVMGNALVCDNAIVFDKAQISGNAIVINDARVFDNAIVRGNAVIQDNAVIRGAVSVCDNAIVRDYVVVCGNADICGDAVISSDEDYIVFKNWWSSGRYFTWTRSNNKWKVGCFYGTGEGLITKAYEDSEEKGKEYERIVKYVEGEDKPYTQTLEKTWKPSQKQLNAIKLAKSFVTDDFGANPTLSETLNELLEQLKKLRE